MTSANANERVRYEPDEPCSILTAAITGFQLAVVMIALLVVPVVIVVRTADQPESYLTWTVFASLAICGIATIFQSLRLGRIGTGHTLVIATSEPAIAICITALMEGGPAMMSSLIVLSSILKFVVAFRLSLLRRFITPVVSGTVLMLIAATVILAVFGTLTDVPEGSPSAAAPLASGVTLAVVALLLLRVPRAWQIWAPIIGIVFGCAIGLPFGLYDLDIVMDSHWIGVPENAWPGLDLTPDTKFWALLPAFLVITMITSFKAVADVAAIQRVSRRQPLASDFRLVQGGLTVNGFSNLVTGLAGTLPTMTASPSVAMVRLTGVASRSVGVWAGGIFLLLAFLPKFTAVLLAIPAPVAAAYIMVVMGLVFVEGVQTVTEDGMDPRKAVVIAVSFWVGMGFQNEAIFADLLSGTWEAVLSNSVTSGGFAAALMIGFVELTTARRRRLEVDLDFAAMPEVDLFLQRFAEKRGWNRETTERVRAVGEETLAIMAQYEAEDASGKERRLIISAQVDDSEMELEFLSAAYDVDNLEDRLAYMSEQPEILDEQEVSFRLLRHYASSVRHQKFHDMDVITARVQV